MKIVVLGGAGKMGCIAVQDLAMDGRVDEIILADIDLSQARLVAETIGNTNVGLYRVDINDHKNLLNVLKGADACLNATVYYSNLRIMKACLESRVHYTDMGGLFHTTLKQLKLNERFKEAKISAVLGMGSAPGVPNMHARYGADRLDTIESVKIYDGIKPNLATDVSFTYAVPTIVDEMTEAPMVFEDGKFASKEPLSEFEDYCFTQPIGVLPMHLSLHSEVATIPISFRDKGIKRCFFKINYWGMPKETIDKIQALIGFGFADRDPVNVDGVEVVPRNLLVKMMSGHVPAVTNFLAPPGDEPPNWSKEIVTEIKGSKNGRELIYRISTLTCKGALPTGVFPARSAIWQADNRVVPGVHPPELAFDPEQMLKEAENRDIFTFTTVSQAI